MRTILFLSVILYFCIVGVIPRSIRSSDNIQQDLEVKERKEDKLKLKDVKLMLKDVDNMIWTGQESIPHPRSHKNKEINSGPERMNSNQLSSELNFQQDNEDDDKSSIEAEIKANRSEMVSKHTESEKDPSNADFTGVKETPVTKLSPVNASEPAFNSSEISDIVLANILNFSANAVILQSLADNTSTMESFTFDETELSDGSEIALFQEVSTIGFELLIDSETKQNLLLTELLSSQSILATEEDYDGEFSTIFTHEVNSASDVVSFDLNLASENELNTTVTDQEPSNAASDIEFNTTVKDIQFNKTIDFNKIVEEEKKNKTDSEDVRTEANIRNKVPQCPEPGWCVFWFMALDTCAKNSHCLGSRICCKLGCSKTCIDVDT